ncbi:MAG TPA: hypothetical protein VIL61_09125 [Nitrospiria bacterium]
MAVETPFIFGNNLAMKATITGQQGADPTFKMARIADGKRYTRWQSTDTVLKNLDFDIPAAYQRPVNCLIMDRGHSLANVVCKFYYSNDGAAWTQVDNFTPASSAVIFRQFSGQTAHRYYRLELGSSSVLHKINQVWFGQGWSLERNPAGSFDPDAERIEFTDFETESGVMVRFLRFRKRTIEMTFPIIQSAMYDNIKILFSDFSIFGGFLWFVWRPTTAPTDILYMIHKIDKRQFDYPGGVHRTGRFIFEEVLG